MSTNDAAIDLLDMIRCRIGKMRTYSQSFFLGRVPAMTIRELGRTGRVSVTERAVLKEEVVLQNPDRLDEVFLFDRLPVRAGTRLFPS